MKLFKKMWYNFVANCNGGESEMKHIKIVVKNTIKDTIKDVNCKECANSCQSACKTSCTVANIVCEK